MYSFVFFLCCFYLLDEESKLPEPTSAHFTNEVYSKNKGYAKLTPLQILRSVTTTRKVPDNHDFLIKHFFDDVSYSTTQFIEKNIDILPYALITLIQKCKNDFLENLFHEILEREQNADRFKCVSVGSMIQSQSINLINKLKTTVSFIYICSFNSTTV
ncbi:unnamed protein product [Rotaria sordida]|uniref:Myosin motor domain-containing protein n=1 Tax=Rotaria sordida TaxID=392033 RepID=A0A819WRB6_9BILA|nr:unnamed protein product [Rotaria sordida]